jgi:ubiquitin C-terminal hydrolase
VKVSFQANAAAVPSNNDTIPGPAAPHPLIHPSISTESLTTTLSSSSSFSSLLIPSQISSTMSAPKQAVSQSSYNSNGNSILCTRPPKGKQLRDIQHLFKQSASASRNHSSISPRPITLPSKPSSQLEAVHTNTEIRPEGNQFVMYILAARWWKQWCKFVHSPPPPVSSNVSAPNSPMRFINKHKQFYLTDSLEDPGKIDNSQLFEESSEENDSLSSANFTLKPGLQFGVDFILVPEVLWSALYGWYSGGPVSSRVIHYQPNGEGSNAHCVYQMPWLKYAVVRELFASEDDWSLICQHLYGDVSNSASRNLSKVKVSPVINDSKLGNDKHSHFAANEENLVAQLETLSVSSGSDNGVGLDNVLEWWSASLQQDIYPHGAVSASITDARDFVSDKANTADLRKPNKQTDVDSIPLAHATSFTEANHKNWSPASSTIPMSSTSTPRKEVKSLLLFEKSCVICGMQTHCCCGACRQIFYCSKVCQRLHWKQHKRFCHPPLVHSPDEFELLVSPNQPLHFNSDGTIVTSTSPRSAVTSADYLLEKKILDMGRVGLANLGNTCYLSSILQCILSITPLSSYFLSQRYLLDVNELNRDGTGGRLVRTFANFVSEIKLLLLQQYQQQQKQEINGNSESSGFLSYYYPSRKQLSYRPKGVKDLLGALRSEYIGNAQHDAHELLEFLLDKLHEDVNRNQFASKPYTEKVEGDGYNDYAIARETWKRLLLRENSCVQDVVGYLMRNELTCYECHTRVVSYEYHQTMEVALPSSTSRHHHKHPSYHDSSGAKRLGKNQEALDLPASVNLLLNLSSVSDQCSSAGGAGNVSSSASNPPSIRNGCVQSSSHRAMITLEDCLRQYTEREALAAGNEWYCSHCRGFKHASKTVTFCRSYLPKVLIITLKRFAQTSYATRQKIDTCVQFPINGLNLSPFCTLVSANESEQGARTSISSNYEDTGSHEDSEEDDIYDLFAICHHYGLCGFGHYTATVREWDIVSNELSENWYHCDDDKVRKLPKEETETMSVSSSAYILFYRRR